MQLLLLVACNPMDGLVRESLGPDASSPYEVHLFREDAGAWRRSEPAIAHAFSSLHADIWNGELVVCGLGSARPPTFWEERFPRLAVGGLVTTDLNAWATRTWDVVADGVSLIDPALVAGPDGEYLWFVQTDGPGDPGERGRDVRLVRTRWNGSAFAEAHTWATGKGLVDPAPVWFGGHWHLFATQDHASVVLVEEGGALRVVLPNATVPFARVVGEHVSLVAQRRMESGVWPVETTTSDLATWTEAAPALPAAVTSGRGPPPPLRTCASPVTASFAGVEALICVDERR